MFKFHVHAKLCSTPVAFYPTTIILVDDDRNHLDKVTRDLSDSYRIDSYSDPNEALNMQKATGTKMLAGEVILGTYQQDIRVFRHEVYNANRFGRKIILILDFDMPDMSGFDMMEIIGTADYFSRATHYYIILSAKRYAEFKGKRAESAEAKNFISKWDPNYKEQLLEQIATLHEHIFQNASYSLATELLHSPTEQTNFLFDNNFLPILNNYLEAQDIYEGYLFDKQGSLLFLDKKANLSWLFIRNEKGIQNSVRLAKQYHAPQAVVTALESKDVILSLYEQQDFASRKTIDWDKYLLPASIFKNEQKESTRLSDYYYAFTQDFPEHGIKQDKILSYEQFLKND